MVVRNISHAKAELFALVEAVQNGNEVILTKAGKPIAWLIAYCVPVLDRWQTAPRCPSRLGRFRLRSEADSRILRELTAGGGANPPGRFAAVAPSRPF
jgi:antitoxin (DNA-binding transcriptional repressor) of toxin-antitoxin stability system